MHAEADKNISYEVHTADCRAINEMQASHAFCALYITTFYWVHNTHLGTLASTGYYISASTGYTTTHLGM